MLGSKTKIAAALVAAAALVLPMTAACAAEQDLEFTNTAGTVSVGDIDLEIAAGDAGLVGTWDDVTGEFTGTTTFNPITIPANPPDVPIAVVVQLINADDNVEGTIDPETGAAELTAAMQFQLTVPGETPIVCASPAFDVTFTDSEALAPLPFDESADYTISLDGSFNMPAFGGDCAIAAIVNDTLGLPTDGTAALDLVRGTPAPPTTPTTPTTTATTTTAAAVATSQPRFTG